MFTVTEYDKMLRQQGVEWRGSLPGLKPRASGDELRNAVLTASLTEILQERTLLLRKLYCEGNPDPSARVIVSQRAVREAFYEAGMAKHDTDRFRRLLSQHLGKEFVIGNIAFNVPGSALAGSVTNNDERYTSFFVHIDPEAVVRSDDESAA